MSHPELFERTFEKFGMTHAIPFFVALLDPNRAVLHESDTSIMNIPFENPFPHLEETTIADLHRSPIGSSSGSATAIAANLATVAVGTETGGSILSPASANGIVGIKPTLGLVSRAGVIPIAHSQDTIGPLARTVALLNALTGVDERDAATRDSMGRVPDDYTNFLDVAGLRGARIGMARQSYFGNSAKADAIVNTAISVPAGYAFELPVGLTFMGRAYSEPTLIRLAYAFEQGTKIRRPPRYLRTVL